MEIRRAMLEDRIDYFLNGANENRDIDACTYATLRLYGDPNQLGLIILYHDENIRRTWKGRQVISLNLAHYANEILSDLPIDRRAALIVDGIACIPPTIASLAECLAGWAITDETEGGSLKPFLRKRCRLKKDGRIFKNTARKLHSPKWIRRYVKNTSSEAAHLRRLFKIVLGRTALVSNELMKGVKGRQAIIDDLKKQLEWYRAEYAAEHLGAIEAQLGTKVLRENDIKRKKLLKRTALVAAGLIGASTVGALARGEPISLVGQTYTLQVQKLTSLAEIGHGNLTVNLLDPNGVKLADLCVYVEGTPAIEQVAGLALFMRAGLEDELLKTANVTIATEEGRNHPLLKERSKREFILTDQILGQTLRVFNRDYETSRVRVRQYWQETKSVWIEALMISVVGAKVAKRMTKYA